MSEQETGISIQRILVALDASTHSLAALEAAAELAGRLNAELFGLFVEDVDLLKLAELPFSREVYRFSAADEPLDTASIERALRVQAERARRALEAAAERARVRWSLRVTRGHVAAEVLAAAVEADLLTLGKASWSLTPEKRLGSTALAAATSAHCALLLVQHGFSLSKPVLVVYNGSPSARQALGIAVSLARASGIDLTVFVAGEAPEAAERLEEQAAELIAGQDLRVRFRRLLGADLPSLARAVRSAGKGILVVGNQSFLPGGEAISKLLSEIEGPLLLVR